MSSPAALLTTFPAGTDSETQRGLAEVLAGVLDVEHVPADAHVFDDLGADSLLMAQFCARVRKRADLPPVSMKAIYRNPTIRELAAALMPAAPDRAVTLEVASAPVEPPAPAPVDVEPAQPVRSWEYVLCGALQLLVLLGYAAVAALVTTWAYGWISSGSGWTEVYSRSVAAGGASLAAMCALPVLAKWALIGRFTPRRIRIWSLGYVRFWVVRTLVQSSPVVHLFAGSPLHVLYLRTLGARIGHGVVILTKHVPVCTDLLTIGDGSVVRREVFLSCHRAIAGVIETGTVTIGRDVVVGENAVLDIDVAIGDGAELAHASALYAGQAVPAGERWHGSPAQPAGAVSHTAAPRRSGGLRRAVYSGAQLLKVLALYLPLVLGGAGVVLGDGSRLSVAGAVILSLALGAGALLGGLLVITTLPRLLDLFIEPDRDYPMYGVHWSIHRAIGRMTNVRFLTQLLGDSSYIVHYLRSLGYDLRNVEQTGSNFGSAVSHDTPFLSSVGSGTIIADGLSIINAEVSSTSFRVSRVRIGARNFLGNHIAYPAQGRTGYDCLLATKVMVPVDGPVREGVGLLGSPCFEIPRSVERDSRLAVTGAELRRRLAAKNRYNLRTIGLVLLVRWIHLLGLTLLAMATAELYRRLGATAVAGEIVASPLAGLALFVLVERAVAGFGGLRPQTCSIYDPYFWWHERYWKFESHQLDRMLNGTPFKSTVSRLRGLRIGRRVFDDGCGITERSLTTIGDGCMLNAGTVIQPHSQEDGAFKSDRIRIGAGCTIGVGALVHYGVTIGDGAVLAADSFLMKGQEVAPRACWGGNPAAEIPAMTAGTERYAPAGTILSVVSGGIR